MSLFAQVSARPDLSTARLIEIANEGHFMADMLCPPLRADATREEAMDFIRAIDRETDSWE